MSGFEIETKDGQRGARVATLPGRAAVPGHDARWKSWFCSGCGIAEAGYNIDMRRTACASCVQRIREGKAILTPEEVWHEALAEMAKDKLCRVCGQKAGPAADALGRGQSVVCRRCLTEAAA
ncbi:hypothetical protein G7043_31325 [Lentzea sp. NEAU-D13]|uniref:Uncharacterized protein n=1 Tax=Lentzea alba TaxID=2714351 RepID=A0A7C9RUY5_9PSEU|nr:hypothetical protein [Lentzea alba]NGY63424.1 hypothetical protein [Lentzea alba]